MKTFVLFISLFLIQRAAGEIVDKVIIEDWSRPIISENNGEIVLRPTLVFVLIDATNNRVIVPEQIWERKRVGDEITFQNKTRNKPSRNPIYRNPRLNRK